MGRRSRKGRPEDGAPAARPAAYARAEARNAAVRATLVPLAPGERPLALRIAIGTALLIGAANLVLWAIGYEVQGRDPGFVGAALFAAVMFVAAWGMWNQKYWAVLGFEALIGLVLVSAALGLVVASNLAGAALALAVVVLCTWLFWKLVRVMGRMQAPQPPGRS